MARLRLYLLFAIEVRPSFALDAFCRCEHMFAMLRIEGIVAVVGLLLLAERRFFG